MPQAFDNSSIVEALQTELVKHTASHTPCAALMLHRLPQLLQATDGIASGASGRPNVAALAVAYAQVHDDLLHELEEKQLLPAVSEVRALARAIHHGILTTLARDPRRGATPDSSPQGSASLDNARLEAADAEQLELLRNVSHELRTPLQAILGWVSLLKGGQLQPEASARALAAIERNAKLQSELITKVVESGTSARFADETV
ncbi:MAG TPA: histidine kinase dimerization/phospho-acceptor domain-containing protein [Polyangiaceae bacterium]